MVASHVAWPSRTLSISLSKIGAFSENIFLMPNQQSKAYLLQIMLATRVKACEERNALCIKVGFELPALPNPPMPEALPKRVGGLADW